MSTEDFSESQPQKVLEDTFSSGGNSFEHRQESKKEDYENSETQSQRAMVKSRSSSFLRSSHASPIHQSRSFKGLEGLDSGAKDIESRKGKSVQESSTDFKMKRIEQWVMDLKHCSLGETEQPVESDHDDGQTAKDTLSNVLRTDAKALPPATDLATKHISSLNPSATAVHLANRGLVAMPFLSSFSSLKVLDLSGNTIVRITAGALPRGLHILNLSKNGISTIEGLRELTRLRVLDLSYNRILRIGHGLASCSSLKELYLAGNKISEVEGLHRLLKLNVLDLRFNKLSTTKSLAQLAANYNSLQAVTLEGNPAQKNVGDEPLKKHLAGLLPHLAYFNRQPIRAGAAKDAADRAARLGISAHQIDSKSKSKGPRKPTTLGPADGPRFVDSSRKAESLRPERGVRRSRSEGLLGTI